MYQRVWVTEKIMVSHLGWALDAALKIFCLRHCYFFYSVPAISHLHWYDGQLDRQEQSRNVRPGTEGHQGRKPGLPATDNCRVKLCPQGDLSSPSTSLFMWFRPPGPSYCRSHGLDPPCPQHVIVVDPITGNTRGQRTASQIPTQAFARQRP